MDNKFFICENINIFGYLRALGGGGGGFNNQTGPILVHIYPLIYINLHVMLGPYIQSRGTEGTKMSANADLITVEIYVQQGKTIENQFFIYRPKCFYFWLFEGPWGGGGGLQWSDWTYLAFQLSSHPYLCTCEIRKHSENKYEFFHIWGFTLNPGLSNFQGSKTSSQSRQIYNKGKNNHRFLGYSGGGGPRWPINNQAAHLWKKSDKDFLSYHENDEVSAA